MINVHTTDVFDILRLYLHAIIGRYVQYNHLAEETIDSAFRYNLNPLNIDTDKK